MSPDGRNLYVIWVLAYAPYMAFQTFWVLLVMTNRGWSEQMVSKAMAFYLCGAASTPLGFRAETVPGISLARQKAASPSKRRLSPLPGTDATETVYQ